MAITPDARLVIGGGFEEATRVWNTQTGKESKALDGKSGGNYCLALSPDGRRVAIGYEKKGIGLWDLASGKLIHRESLEAGDSGTEGILTVAFSPDGRKLVAGGRANLVYVVTLPRLP